jgi:peptide-methionine (S)-S-oxide reductase
VGYTGGTTLNPTYHNIGDHTESIQVEYDPEQISYEHLLDVFSQGHDPTRMFFSRQYMSAIFYANEKQQKAALAWKERIEKETGRSVKTQILPLQTFYLAEAYHQKYWLRLNRELFREYEHRYSSLEEFLKSTAVSRVNGYLGGYGTIETFDKELSSLELSEEGQRRLRNIVLSR